MTNGIKWSMILMLNMQFLLYFTLGNYLIFNVFGIPVSSTTVVDYDAFTGLNEKVTLTSESYVMLNINCTFMTEIEYLPKKIDSQMTKDTKLLVFAIHFPGWSGNILGFEQGNLYKPSHWVLARGRLGKGLLLLKQDYEILSLLTLSLNTQKMDIFLIQSTPNCIEKMNVSTFEIAVRELLLNNLEKNEAGDAICNMNIADDNGELPKENVGEVMYFPGDQQRNLAFSVKTDDLKALEDPVSLVKAEFGFLRWRTSRLILFLSTNDMPFVPRKFFFDACKMPHYFCPGELLFNYLRAFGEFSTIVAFLLFVLVIVLAFGETNQLSATNQLLATLAGGFLPWIFMNVVFRTHVPPSLDNSNPNFKICISQLLDKYKQDWPIDDNVVEEFNEIHKYGDDVISGTGMTLNIPSSSGIDENDIVSVVRLVFRYL
ncbi:hypothetical protein CHS0354_017702 [Potamilus streckersoni]|uniref:Uncharacterized protein n=1 Tax=Potamilus streckersoni TaxID=2493646 RepID=A0AAE0S3C4_9BIVA|nr:hypothetical protein CHS0354_017702 [Potamilus streckersoni]